MSENLFQPTNNINISNTENLLDVLLLMLINVNHSCLIRHNDTVFPIVATAAPYIGKIIQNIIVFEKGRKFGILEFVFWF